LRLITKVSLLACSIGRSPGLGASKEERHLVPSTLIRQNGCPNYIKFRNALNGIQNRDLSCTQERFILAHKRDAPWPTTNR
jgi:hypothetical protein